MKKKGKADPKAQTARELTDVRDIRRGVIYGKGSQVTSIQKIAPINIHLISEKEKLRIADQLTASFRNEKKRFAFMAIPRTVDVESYLEFLVKNYEEELQDIHRKKILNIMIREASQAITGRSNFEHQFYAICQEGIESTKEKAVEKLLERAVGLANSFEENKQHCTQLNDTELLRLCNLFANGTPALMEDYGNKDYIPLPMLKRGGE